ncbi:hypothetical protein [Bradyrhizobium sp. DASA03007]|uniref:hypothetical protein n=1 Tax=unclassified Bradyrhizobium TaxID=2631580 RepID=UPI003F6F8793
MNRVLLDANADCTNAFVGGVVRKLTQELAARGIKTDMRAVWTFVHTEGRRFNKMLIPAEQDSPDAARKGCVGKHIKAGSTSRGWFFIVADEVGHTADALVPNARVRSLLKDCETVGANGTHGGIPSKRLHDLSRGSGSWRYKGERAAIVGIVPSKTVGKGMAQIRRIVRRLADILRLAIRMA